MTECNIRNYRRHHLRDLRAVQIGSLDSVDEIIIALELTKLGGLAALRAMNKYPMIGYK
jgi:hypothetical protein